MFSPNRIDEIATDVYASRLCHELCEKIEFSACEFNWSIIDVKCARIEIDEELSGLQCSWRHRRCGVVSVQK